MSKGHLDFVFADNKLNQDLLFVEVELNGKSIKIGEWVKRPDGYSALRITAEEAERMNEELRK